MSDNTTLKYEVFGVCKSRICNRKKSKIFLHAPNTIKIRRILMHRKSRFSNAVEKSTIFRAAKLKILHVSCSRVRREILELLYKQGRICSAGVKEEFLIEKLEAKVDANELKVHVDYLAEREYVLIKPVYDGFITVQKITITAKGTDLVGNPRL